MINLQFGKPWQSHVKKWHSQSQKETHYSVLFFDGVDIDTELVPKKNFHFYTRDSDHCNHV